MKSSSLAKVVFVALIAILGIQAWKNNRPLPPSKIEWWSNVEPAMAYAKKNNKPVLLEFYADWCGVCKDMERNTLRDPGVEAVLAKVVPVRVDVDDPRNATLAERFKVSGIPAVHLLDSNGEEIGSFVGGASPAQFVKAINGSLP